MAVASRTDMILQACDAAGFETFIATGLKFTRGDRARRRAFFTLEDRLAAQVLEQAAGALTFSRSERNETDCLRVLNAGGNVAVVFRRPPFPRLFWGYPVIDGDANDLRFLDRSPCIVGLKAKGKGARVDRTGFVIDTGRLPRPDAIPRPKNSDAVEPPAVLSIDTAEGRTV